jgi:hypothetical protein
MSNQKSITAIQTNQSNSSFNNSMFELLNLNDKYAESIESDFYKYDGLEIHGVKIIHSSNNPKGTCCEVNEESPFFFSVYVHLKPYDDFGGIECVGDFGTHELAKQYAAELATKYEWSVLDCVESTAVTLN